jgi:formylglycine-generating enzyme
VSGATLLVLMVVFVGAAQDPGREPAETTSDMILIPGGELLMGRAGDTYDTPVHRIQVSPFLLDRHEVTNADYLRFCQATGRELPEYWGMPAFRSGPDFPEHPVVGVSWSEASAFAEWRGKRLPTEAEWEMAARGGLVGKSYPNGDEISPKIANYAHEGRRQGTLSVGSFPPNGYGLLDMAGNVSEWVADYYAVDYYEHSPSRDPRGPERGRFRVFRGGGWHSGASCNRVDYRNALPPNWRDVAVGFRCARDLEPGAGPGAE